MFGTGTDVGGARGRDDNEGNGSLSKVIWKTL